MRNAKRKLGQRGKQRNPSKYFSAGTAYAKHVN